MATAASHSDGAAWSDPQTRLAEIRLQNYGGDVTTKDIWWLFDVAKAALDYERHPSRAALSALREELWWLASAVEDSPGGET